jgi:glycosyltransferase involved in cell wall biosynthesis
MRLVIDMQGAQTASRFRGIGRYTMNLVKEMVRQRGEHEIILALNAAYADTIEPVRAAFADLLPFEAIRVFEVVGPVSGHDAANDARRRVAEAMVEAFLSSLQPDVIFIPSLFEGFGEDAVTSVHCLHNVIPTVVTLHDLIPLVHRGVYLQDPPMERWYLNKLDYLRRADLFLAVSDATRREAIQYLNVPDSSVVTVANGCEAHFRPITLSDAQHTYLKQAYGIDRAFVLGAGDTDHRKNLDGLFRAFASLPSETRRAHALVLNGHGVGAQKTHWLALAQQAGLREDELVFTGYVSDQDLALLYNACTLFVFPSWHEGFGLPALEAMSCGAAVIAANSSSLPEVVGREDALFAPRDVAAMTAKMSEVLGSPEFRRELERHGLEQTKRFSWETSARRALAALEALHQTKRQNRPWQPPAKRPRLAFVSPLPPEKTGIADFAAELLPELARHYDITVVVQQAQVVSPWIQANTPIKDAAWLRTHAQHFDRVVYQFGNSPFHDYMFDLLVAIPGVVVLHDFYLSWPVWHRDEYGPAQHGWARALLAGHGWNAVCERLQAGTWKDVVDVLTAYPCNLAVLQQAQGIIVHSNFCRGLARQFYGELAADDWAVIPLLRQPAEQENKAIARQRLGLAAAEFVVCSFGGLAPTKLNHRMLDVWLDSPLAKDSRCRLVFVGEKQIEDYGQELVRKIAQSSAKDRITITGWANMDTYRSWLAVADIAVQLRTLSRGETSAAVLDCMNYGIPTIVNANGSMADLPGDVVCMLPDDFSDKQLVAALDHLWRDEGHRSELGARARAHIRAQHNPYCCAQQYAVAIESAYGKFSRGSDVVTRALSQISPQLSPSECARQASTIANNLPQQPCKSQLLLDVSELINRDLGTGIQRVTRTLLREIVLAPPVGWTVEAVYATTEQPGYRYARKFLSRFLGIADDWAEDAPVQAWHGDVFLGLDLQPNVVNAQVSALQAWHRRGVGVYFVVYDLLPVTMPEVFPPEGTRDLHHKWLSTITHFDGGLCISRSVADRLLEWLKTFGQKRERPFALSWFHLGADVDYSVPYCSIPANLPEIMRPLNGRPTFLMVGTIEPRKGYLQTLHAFDSLWAQGVDVNLIIVGREGWRPVPNDQRRDIPQTVNALRNHNELGRRLFWLEGISDEYLEQIYAHGTCLIAASLDEGFGLPLIEAARHNLPLLVRDIPVFREVTAGNAHFFADRLEPQVISEAVKAWLEQYRHGKHKRSDGMSQQTWKDSARQVLDAILGTAAPYKTWLPDRVRRYWGSDPRLHTKVGQRSGRAIHTTDKEGYLIYGPYEHFESGRYRLIVRGSADYLSGEEWIDIVCDQGSKKLLHFQLQEQDSGVWQEMRGLDIEGECSDLEIRLWVTEATRVHLSDIELKRIDDAFDNEFVVVNKSYRKDLEWSLALYRSYSRYAVRNAPFFIIAPRKDVAIFTQSFADEMQCGRIAEMPLILSEEDVLDVADTRCPPEFSGWHVQQIIKLCFSKTGFARHYLTLDSAMIFMKAWDYQDLYSDDGVLCTAATRVRKEEFYGDYMQVDEKGWLNSELVNLSQCLESICIFMGNITEFTHWYIAGNGFFDSECAKGLEAYARQKDVDGFVGLIRMAPYEFAWYGEYLYTQRQDQFVPKGPLIMQPCIDLESLAEFYEGKLQVPEHFCGVLFQPPASEQFEFKYIDVVKIGES